MKKVRFAVLTALCLYVCMVSCALAQCEVCGGDGLCNKCNGLGFLMAKVFGSDELVRVTCVGENCDDGKCTACAKTAAEPAVDSQKKDDLYAEVREIPSSHMDAVLMMDTSGSMGSRSAHRNKMIISYAQEAAEVFIKQAFSGSTDARVALGTFASSARGLQDMTAKDDIASLHSAVNGIRVGGQTNIADGFARASQMLDESGRKDARQVLVLFSDGIHNCEGDPVDAGKQAMTGKNGSQRDIYTVGLVGALSDTEKRKVRTILDRSYAVRYIEIDEEEQIEGAFYLLGLAASDGDPEHRIHTLRVRGAGRVEVTDKHTGEVLASGQTDRCSFGSLYMAGGDYEAIYLLNEGEYDLRVYGEDVRTIGIVMETIDGRAVSVSKPADLRFNGDAGTRLSAQFSFVDGTFDLEDQSFDPYTYHGNDPFTGKYYAPRYELKVASGIANLPNGGLVSQRSNGYSASVPNEANMPDRVHEQHLEIFNPFFETEGFIVQSRTAYNTNYDGYTYFFGGGDMKLYRIAENGGEKESVINKKLIAYWVDDTGIYYGDSNSIIRREHGQSIGKTIVRHGVASGSNLSRMIRFGEELYFISAKDRCIYAVPYIGGEPRKITNEAARCLSLAQRGNDVILIYNTYDKSRTVQYLRAIDLNGEPVEELDTLRGINSLYFNYAHGYLYYSDKDDGQALYRMDLNNPREIDKLADICSSRIFVFDDYIVTTNDSKYFCVMRPDGSEFKTIYAPYATD